MNNLAQQLLDIKEELENSEKEQGILEGRLQELYSILETQWECGDFTKTKDLQEAIALLDSLETRHNETSTQIGEIKNKLSEYGWDL